MMEANPAEGKLVEDSAVRNNPPGVPAYEEWPSVPKGPIQSYYGGGAVSTTGSTILSMEDIEAAQALEGLRAGTLTLTFYTLTTCLRLLTRHDECTTISTWPSARQG